MVDGDTRPRENREMAPSMPSLPLDHKDYYATNKWLFLEIVFCIH